MFRLFALLFILAGCSAAPQKSFTPNLGTFETAFVETGRTSDAWSVAHIVRTDGQYALVIYLRRADGRAAGITHLGDAAFDVQRVQIGELRGTVIPHTADIMAQAAKSGFKTTLCGSLGCYPIKVPATLYQQALLE